MPKILMPPRGQPNLARGTNLGGKLDEAQANHFVGLKRQPHISQLGSKMIKGEGNNMGMAKDMGVINQGREKTRSENLQKTTQSTKMN